MATKLMSRKVFILTPEHAQKAHSATSIPGERKKKKSRLDYILDLVENGQFCRADFAYAQCAEDNRQYRVNGNHTSTVLSECITNEEMPDFPQNVPLVVEEWACDRIDELAIIFDSYDNPRSNRTAGDRLGVHVAMHSDRLDGCSRDIVGAAVRGVNMSRQRLKDPDQPSYRQWEVGELLSSDEVVEFCHFLQGFRDDTWQGWKDKGICAAVYRSWSESEDHAQAIWSECFDEQDEDETALSRKFVNRMRTERGRRQRSSDWFYSEALKYWKRRKKEIGTV